MKNLHSYHHDPRSRARMALVTGLIGGLVALCYAVPSAGPFALIGGAGVLWKLLWPMLRGGRAGSKITPTRLTYYFRSHEAATEDCRSFLLAHIHSLRIDRSAGLIRLTDNIGDWHDLPLCAFPKPETLAIWLERTGIRLEVGPLPTDAAPLAA